MASVDNWMTTCSDHLSGNDHSMNIVTFHTLSVSPQTFCAQKGAREVVDDWTGTWWLNASTLARAKRHSASDMALGLKASQVSLRKVATPCGEQAKRNKTPQTTEPPSPPASVTELEKTKCRSQRRANTESNARKGVLAGLTTESVGEWSSADEVTHTHTFRRDASNHVCRGKRHGGQCMCICFPCLVQCAALA